jgi:hypothetical protein
VEPGLSCAYAGKARPKAPSTPREAVGYVDTVIAQ